MKPINRNVVLFFCLLIIILIGAVIRYLQLDSHFSHVDDLISVEIYTKLTYSKINEKLNINLSQENKALLVKLLMFGKNLIYPLAVSTYSTYAPAQFLLTGFLISDNYSYRDLLFWNRMPSFIFSTFSFFTLIFCFRSLCKKNYLELSLLGVSTLVFSWMFIIYSVQSESYSIGILSALLLFILIVNYFKNIKIIKTKQTIYYGLAIGIFMYSNYQIIFFLPGIVLTIFLLYKQTFNSVPKYFYIFTAILVSFFSILYCLFLRKNIDSGVNWNAGPNNEFLFSTDGLSLIESIYYFFEFFIVNTYYMIGSIIGISEQDSIVFTSYTILAIIFSLIGLLNILISRDYIKKYFGIFTIITIIIWIVLILLQKITLSPTRHSLILLSFIAVYLPFGLLALLKCLRLNIFWKNFIFINIVLCQLILFFISFDEIRKQRDDKFNEYEIQELVDKFDINYIVTTGWTWNLSFMKHIKNNFETFRLDNGDLIYIKKIKNSINYMFISHRNNSLSEDYIASYIDRNNFSLVYKKEIFSETEICFSPMTKNGTNSIYVYIFQEQKKE